MSQQLAPDTAAILIAVGLCVAIATGALALVWISGDRWRERLRDYARAIAWMIVFMAIGRAVAVLAGPGAKPQDWSSIALIGTGAMVLLGLIALSTFSAQRPRNGGSA